MELMKKDLSLAKSQSPQRKPFWPLLLSLYVGTFVLKRFFSETTDVFECEKALWRA
jgi:hypothetical protein